MSKMRSQYMLKKKRKPSLIQTQEEREEQAKEELGKEIHSVHRKGKLKRELKDLAIFMALITAAVSGRVALQQIPSVEPIIPFAILAGLLFGIKEGAVAGSASYIISNFFVWGLQGPWTIFMALGGGLAGMLGGVAGRYVKPSVKVLVGVTLIGTILYEVLMNISGSLLGIGLIGGLMGIPLYFLTSAPFTLTHIITNLGFAAVMKPLLKLRRKPDELKVFSVSRDDGKHKHTVRMYSANE